MPIAKIYIILIVLFFYMDELIKKLLKTRDVCKRRSILEKEGIDKDEIEEILNLVHLQIKGKLKFPRANLMKFSREGLAQASSKYLAEYRTWKIRNKLDEVPNCLDVCCGIGGDSIAMATRWKVVAVEKDKDTIDMAKHNMRVYNLEKNIDFVQGDINKLIEDRNFLDKVRNVNCIFFDPARRAKEGRTVKVEEYAPPLSFVEKLQAISPNICVKISPGTDLYRIKYDCDIEVVSYKGEVKEVMLWFGNFKEKPESNQILASKLPEKITLIKDKSKLNVLQSEPKKYLYEPDPAFIKAHLIDDLAKEFGLNLIDTKIAYLTGNEKIETPLLNRYSVKRVLNPAFEKINSSLSELNIGRLDFKARGVKVDLHNIHRKIRGKGRNEGLVIFTKVNRENQAIICMYDR
ncbi:methyltransferase domain-containing protein [Methanosarcina sp. MTP4]|uniref:methyltransferase domain-containing protein n=1 Tax=Methanosarcina sp. MTP4 TaxID=1434100 RepID=UPI00064F0D57|nr:methyltransferase domain-containing protein [Methanosarcina sp. MTP4]